MIPIGQPVPDMLHADVDLRFRLMVKRGINTDSHDDTRKDQDDKQDGCIQASDLRRDLGLPQEMTQTRPLTLALIP